jgi:hypothetical protein
LQEVKKNRFDGTLGFAPLYFDHGSGRYLEKAPTGDPNANQLKPRIDASRFANNPGPNKGSSSPWEKRFNTLPPELQ